MPFNHNLSKNQLIGLILVFFGASWIGYGLYATFLAANGAIEQVQLVSGNTMLIFPLFYGVGTLLMFLGKVELMSNFHKG